MRKMSRKKPKNKREIGQFYAQITPKFFQIKLSLSKLTSKNALIWNIFDIKNEHFKQETVQNVHLAAHAKNELLTRFCSSPELTNPFIYKGFSDLPLYDIIKCFFKKLLVFEFFLRINFVEFELNTSRLLAFI